MKILFALCSAAAVVITAGCAQSTENEVNNQETEEVAASNTENTENENSENEIHGNEVNIDEETENNAENLEENNASETNTAPLSTNNNAESEVNENEENFAEEAENEENTLENYAENEAVPLTSADFDIPNTEYVYEEIPSFDWMNNDNYELELSGTLGSVDEALDIDVSGRAIIDYYPDFEEIAMEMENGYVYNGLGELNMIRHGDGFVNSDNMEEYYGVFDNDEMIFGNKTFPHNEDSPATSRYMMRGEFEEPHLHGDGVSYFPHNDLVNYVGTFQQGVPHSDTAEYQAMRCDNGREAGAMNDRCYGLAYFGDFTEVDWEYDLQITNIVREGFGASFYILTGEMLGVEPLAGEGADSPFPDSDVYSFSDGSIEYYGEWVYDKFHGTGTYFYPDGQAKLHGEFYEGVPHGEAVHFSEAGDVLYKGNYDMGIPIEDEEAFFFEQEDLPSQSLKYRTFLDPQLDH